MSLLRFECQFEFTAAEEVESDEGIVDPNAEPESWQRAISLLNMWRHCHGMHTVEKCVEDYHKHPGGWGALLMIHGVPEVTARLRCKVDNCAIYSALFLSKSTQVLFESAFVGSNSVSAWGSLEEWLHDVRKRVFFYAVSVSIALHFLSILLAMAFNDVLNRLLAIATPSAGSCKDRAICPPSGANRHSLVVVVPSSWASGLT